MKKKIMMIGMSVFMTMTGLKAQQEILDKNDFFDGRTWTVVDTFHEYEHEYHSEYHKHNYGEKWYNKRENQNIIACITSAIMVPVIALITWGSDDDSYTGNSNSGGCTLVQCMGFTQSGVRCQRSTTNCNGRCFQH